MAGWFVFVVLSWLLLFPLVSLAFFKPELGVQEEYQLEEEMANLPSRVPLTETQRKQIFALEQEGQRMGWDNPNFKSHWMKVFSLNPGHPTANMQLGIMMMSGGNALEQLRGIMLIERCYDEDKVDGAIQMPNPPGVLMAMVVGRFRWERREYGPADRFLTMANLGATELDMDGPKHCTAASLATMLDPTPNTTELADQMMEKYMEAAEFFLNFYRNPRMDEKQLGQTVSGASNDPYVHCVMTIFHLSFYHRADVARAARLHYRVATRLWPQLNYVSPGIPKKAPKTKSCTNGKIKLGIASGLLSHQSPVVSDFQGVLQRLDRDKFEITYMYFTAKGEEPDRFVFSNPKDKFVPLEKQPEDVNNGAWVSRHYKTIEEMNLDILLYLDLTMNPMATRVSMARLAPVQATSHGHPVTSGVPAVDYYISWGAAEIETAAEHYSEKLVLLDDKVPHQYYKPRHDEEGRSVLDGMVYKGLDKRSTFSSVPEDGNWYTCMQKPHKWMPEMDSLICGVIVQDLKGRLILHEAPTAPADRGIKERLTAAGCDMDRVHFIPSQIHHRLLALYAVSDVILDSYPAGGCTTTREALELNKLVVTLPSRLLGGRWSYAYYQIMGDQVLNEHVIASDEEDYIKKAVALGTDSELRSKMEARIELSLPNLYGQDSAVESWEKVLLQISPVERNETCSAAA